MALLRIALKCSYTYLNAALFRQTAPCHETLIHIFEVDSR
jgi:hypothetical protein